MTGHNKNVNGQMAMPKGAHHAQRSWCGNAAAKGESGVISNWKRTIVGATRAFFVLMALAMSWAGNAWAVSSTTTLASNINPSNLGQTVTLTATVTGGHTTPTGIVNFVWLNSPSGAIVIGTGTLNSSAVASINYAFSAGGSLNLEADYSGDSHYASGYGTLTQTVNQATSSTVVTTSPNPSTAGQAVTVTATVSGYSPTGTVDFYLGTTNVGTYTLTNGQAVMTYGGLPSGSYAFSARYAGDGANTASTSAPVTQTVNAASSTTTLATTPNPSSTGQTVTLAATVAGYSSTGTVTFMDGTTTLGTATLNGSHVATLSYAFASTGTHSLTASYGGDANNLGSTSSAVSQQVEQPATTVLAASPNPSTVGQAVTLTANVTGSSPTGTVTFLDGTTTLGTGTLNGGTATLSYTFNTAGTHSLTASYGGDANNGPSTSSAVSQTVNKAVTSITMGSSPNPSGTNQVVTLTYQLTGGASPTGTITFYDGATQIASEPYSLFVFSPPTYTFTTTGNHNLTVVYGGDANNAASTSSVDVQSVLAGTATTLTSSTNPSNAGQPVILTAAVTGNSPTGTVTFEDGGIAVGTGTLNGTGTATLSYTFNTVTTHYITAVYGGDANNATSTSATLNQTVNQAGTTTVLSSSPNPSGVGQGFTMTATVSGASPTGTVTFYDGTTAISTQTVVGGVAIRDWSFTTQGTHSLTANYAGDANNLASTSAAMNQTVTQYASSATLSSNLNPSTVGYAITLSANVTGYNPTGTVTFMNGTTTLGTVTLTNQGANSIITNGASLSYTFAAGGTYNLTASYSGDANNAAATSAVYTQTVNKYVTSTSLTTSANPAMVGQPVTLTATVTGTNLTGTVTFLDGTTTLGTVPVGATGTATLSYTFNTNGVHGLTAAYGSDPVNADSTSNVVSETVDVATTTVLVPSVNPAAPQQPITLTATVTGSQPTGTVTFLDGTATIGTGTLNGAGVATLNYTYYNTGTHSLTASYAGNAGNASSTSTPVSESIVMVNSTTTLSSSPSTSAPNQAVTLTATISGYSSPSGQVTFLDGTTTLGTANVSSGVGTLRYTFATTGTHSLTASYSGDASDNASTSSPVTQTVTAATSVTTLSSNVNPSALNQAVVLTATVAGSSPSGQVTFLDGTTTLGMANVVNGGASLPYTFTAMSAHSLTASYAGDANNLASTSTALNQTVGKANTATTVGSSANPSAPNQAVTLTATVTGSSPTGNVTFMDGTTTLGTGTLTNGTASLSYAFTTAGTHTLIASYGGDASNNGSTSPVTSQGVGTGATVYYIQPDQLGTPRTVTDTAGNVVWQWDNADPFGNNAPNENPSNQGTFHFNLRFPGQYYDTETNLAYNVNRDYDAATGTYIESDAMGLGGGINTYVYVGGRPLIYVDPMGLYETGGVANKDDITTICDGNGNVVPQYQDALTQDEKDCVGDCVRMHEDYHVSDIMKKAPNVCRGKRAGTKVIFSDAMERRTQEIKAYSIAIECLKDALNKLMAENCDKCKDIIKNRLKFDEHARDVFRDGRENEPGAFDEPTQ